MCSKLATELVSVLLERSSLSNGPNLYSAFMAPLNNPLEVQMVRLSDGILEQWDRQELAKNVLTKHIPQVERQSPSFLTSRDTWSFCGTIVVMRELVTRQGME